MQKMLLAIISFLFTNCNFAQTFSSLDSAQYRYDSLAKAGSKFTFYKVEQESEFPGGNYAWSDYLQSNLNADVPVKKNAPKGTYMVIIAFIVSSTGAISDLRAETKYGYGMEEEVIRVIKKGPKWQPGMQDGRPVNSYRRQPVTFVVE